MSFYLYKLKCRQRKMPVFIGKEIDESIGWILTDGRESNNRNNQFRFRRNIDVMNNSLNTIF